MTADEWNAAHPVGTPVVAYAASRTGQPLYTRTRTPAWTLGHGTPVVAVEDRPGGIALDHVDVGWLLTPESHSAIEGVLDRQGVFAKNYWRPVDGKNTTVGLRIGVRPHHVVARYGDTILGCPDGRYTVLAAQAGDES